MRRIWEPCSFVGQKGVCTVCFPTFYIFMYPHIQIAVSVDAKDLASGAGSSRLSARDRDVPVCRPAGGVGGAPRVRGAIRG